MTKCDLLGPHRNFSYFREMLRTWILLLGQNWLCFFSSTASHDLQIFTIASICSPNKEIMFLPILFCVLKAGMEVCV